MVERAKAVSLLDSRIGERVWIRTRVVWRGSSESHDSSYLHISILQLDLSRHWDVRLTHVMEGVKNSFAPTMGVALTLVRLVMLFWRENVDCPTGILPLAFSDMPRS